jgi:thiol-disulfide isomerase/thioredoxin
MDKTIRIITALLILAAFGCVFFLLAVPGISPLQNMTGTGGISSDGKITVYFFYGEECLACNSLMPFMQSLEQKYPDADIQYLEIWHNQTNYALYYTLNTDTGIKNPVVPEVFVGTTVLTGTRDIPARLEGIIVGELKKKH